MPCSSYACNSWDTVLLNTFVIKKIKHKVYFNRGTVIWETEAPPYCRVTLPIDDVLAVNYVHSKDLSCCYYETGRIRSGSMETESAIENVAHHNSFSLHYACKGKRNKWKYHVVTMCHADPKLVTSWVVTLRSFLTGLSSRPRRLMLFVNPFGGKKRALKIYEKKVKPLFDLVNIDIDLTITQRRNHVKDTLVSSNLDGFDGIVCIGGDGTFAEVINGLILRMAQDIHINVNNPDCELPKPLLRVGVIPGGSTNTIAYCLHGTTDIETAAIHIIIGKSSGVDVSSVHSEKALLSYYASVISYGYLGDIARDSDRLRWMGPKRYDFTGFMKFINNIGYNAEIVFLTDSSSPYEDSKCIKNCRRCESKKQGYVNRNEESEWKQIKGTFLMVNGANMSCACPRTPNGISPHCHIGDGCLDLVLVKHTSLLNNVRLLMTLSNRMKSIYDLPFVEVHRTKAFMCRALPSPPVHPSDNSVWNCDGEVLFDTFLHVRTHCQLLQVFHQGLEMCIEHTQKCCRCF